MTKNRIKVIDHGLTLEGELTLFQCGLGGDLILEFSSGARVELHGVPEKLLNQMNKFGLMIVQCATIDVRSGIMTIDKTGK